MASFLESNSTFVWSGDAADLVDGVRLLEKKPTDIVILGTSLEGGAAKTIRALTDFQPDLKCLVLTSSRSEQDLTSSMAAGADGYLLKTADRSEILMALESIARGQKYVTPYFAAQMLARIGGGESLENKEKRELLETLSTRETQVLKRAAVGATNREIADELTLSEKTVKHYMTIVLQKINARNRVEAALIYRKFTSQPVEETA